MSYELTDADVLDACARSDDRLERKMGDICDTYTNKGGKKMTPITMGMTLADVNNDGLTDAIIAGSIGYQKVFLNTSPGHQEDSNGNRFVSSRLEDDGIEVNKYGIGVTLRLFTTSVQDRNQRKIQFREISSYQHYSDTVSSIDEKVTFGLGENWEPMKLEAVWPNGRKQILFLKGFDLSSSVSYSSSMEEPIQVRYPPKNNQYFRIQNLKSQESSGAEKLCLCLGPGDDWKNVDASE